MDSRSSERTFARQSPRRETSAVCPRQNIQRRERKRLCSTVCRRTGQCCRYGGHSIFGDKDRRRSDGRIGAGLLATDSRALWIESGSGQCPHGPNLFLYDAGRRRKGANGLFLALCYGGFNSAQGSLRRRLWQRSRRRSARNCDEKRFDKPQPLFGRRSALPLPTSPKLASRSRCRQDFGIQFDDRSGGGFAWPKTG